MAGAASEQTRSMHLPRTGASCITRRLHSILLVCGTTHPGSPPSSIFS
ncbi:hypothetical protein SCE1572_37630 [Sorangium cellulosum So0157-2]|uniref:Uncharacterized protein n=1 Tax=Sorangium cellulosum So0157-2 TaxID=1254432 RepID=S4YAA2_SORCE|nr:hypothetical protein SCE1572_37630 [Sorangium cellulosum So0157-2]